MNRTGDINRYALLLAVLICLISSFGCEPGWWMHTHDNQVQADTTARISQYDPIIKAWADTLGWDWKLLAALIYQESRFNPEAVSPAGARGLMQLRPRTARIYGCEDPLDPEQNIRAGVMLLLDLRERYKGLAADDEELTKFTLAAYNAGSGRIRDCISHARHMGLDASRWKNVAAVIPQMQEDSVAALGHIKHGAFKGRETVAFVRQIYSRRNHYSKIIP